MGSMGGSGFIAAATGAASTGGAAATSAGGKNASGTGAGARAGGYTATGIVAASESMPAAGGSATDRTRSRSRWARPVGSSVACDGADDADGLGATSADGIGILELVLALPRWRQSGFFVRKFWSCALVTIVKARSIAIPIWSRVGD